MNLFLHLVGPFDGSEFKIISSKSGLHVFLDQSMYICYTYLKSHLDFKFNFFYKAIKPLNSNLNSSNDWLYNNFILKNHIPDILSTITLPYPANVNQWLFSPAIHGINLINYFYIFTFVLKYKYIFLILFTYMSNVFFSTAVKNISVFPNKFTYNINNNIYQGFLNYIYYNKNLHYLLGQTSFVFYAFLLALLILTFGLMGNIFIQLLLIIFINLNIRIFSNYIIYFLTLFSLIRNGNSQHSSWNNSNIHMHMFIWGNFIYVFFLSLYDILKYKSSKNASFFFK